MMHQPVLSNQVLEALQVEHDHWYLDATFGRGGHTRGILNQGGKVIALDVDHEAIEYGSKEFEREIDRGKLYLIRENFSQIKRVVAAFKQRQNVTSLSGILFDFGTSTNQLTSKHRGFSFDSDTQLDMRMDDRLGVTAADLLGALSEKQLTELFRENGEQDAKKIAKAIVAQRAAEKPITTTQELVGVIRQVKRQTSHLHPATKVFQALRVTVNSELDAIATALPDAIELIAQGCVITISFHEGEDRIAKQTFKQAQNRGEGTSEDLVMPNQAEIQVNPRARSAKMRVFRK